MHDSEGSVSRYETRHDHLTELFREDEQDFVFFFDSCGYYRVVGGGCSTGVAVGVGGGVGGVVGGGVVIGVVGGGCGSPLDRGGGGGGA